MHVDEIREALHKQPFEPLSLRLADGTNRFIPHPDFIAVARRRVAVFDPATEALSILEPLLIVSIEYPGKTPIPPAAQNTQGGTS